MISTTDSADAAVTLLRYAAAALKKDPDPARASEAFTVTIDEILKKYEGDLGRDLKKLRTQWAAFSDLSKADRRVLAAKTQRLAMILASELPVPVKNRRRTGAASSPGSSSAINGAQLSELQELPGVGPAVAQKLAANGIKSPENLIWFLPRRYEDRRKRKHISEVETGESVLVEGVVVSNRRYGRGRRKRTELVVEQDQARIRAVWFRGMGPTAKRYPRKSRVVLAGKVNEYRESKQMVHPDITPADTASSSTGVVPLYTEMPGIPPRTLAKIVRAAVERLKDSIIDGVPVEFLSRHNLPDLGEALCQLHLPPPSLEEEDVARWSDGDSPGRVRLAYDEFLHHQIAAARRRVVSDSLKAPALSGDRSIVREVEKAVGFEFTQAQRRSALEILHDLSQPRPARRLLQGDVGSGKTAVALAAVLSALKCKKQAALMAPTEILASQHARNLFPVLEKAGYRTALVLGKMRAGVKREVSRGLENGDIHLAVGTHALIENWVCFSDLGLSIIDEQHRFGVHQRVRLGSKAGARTPHLLVLTATPIPRTLAHAVWGDLDLSVIDELPPGRNPTETFVYTASQRQRAYELVEDEIGSGAQVFVICPLIQESEVMDLANAEGVYEELVKRFGDDRVALMHGRLHSDEKERAMKRFADGETSVLVSTTVVEVGVDVPNASLMIVESAERFGLCQLHQLRGRVGRGGGQSRCLLIPGTDRAASCRRLEIMSSTTDGFKLAEEDMKLRGPGQIYGVRQAGLPGFRYGHLMRDSAVLSWARHDALELLKKDPSLFSTQNLKLIELLEKRHGSMEKSIAEEAG